MSSYRSGYAPWSKNDTNKTTTTNTKPKLASEVPVAKKYDSSYSRSKPDSTTKESIRPTTGLDKPSQSRYSSLGSSSFRSTYSPSPSTYSRDKSGTRESSSTSTSSRYPSSYTEDKPEKQTVLNKYMSAKSADKSDSSSTYSRLTVPTKPASRDHSPVDKAYNSYSSRNSTTTPSRTYHEDISSKIKAPLPTKDKTRDTGATEREKDIPNKSNKSPSYSTSAYPSFKLYQRPSTYSRPIVKEEPKIETTNTSRFSTPSRFGSSYTRSSLVDKPTTPYASQTSSVSANANMPNGPETKPANHVTESISTNQNNVQSKSEEPLNKEVESPPKDDEEETSSEDESSDSEAMSMISVTVVTRGTSPTAPSSSIYLRTRRADMAKTIEKTISRPKKRCEMVDKEMQSDRLDDSTRSSRYASTSRVSASPWSSYMDTRYSSPISSGRYTSGRYSTYTSPRDTSSSVSTAGADKTPEPGKKEEISAIKEETPPTKPLESEVIEKSRESPIKTHSSFLPITSPISAIPLMTSDSSSTTKSEDIPESPPKASFFKEKSKSPSLLNETSAHSSPERCLDQLPPQVPKSESVTLNKSASSTNSVNKTTKSGGKKIVKKIKIKPKDGEQKPKRQLRKSVSTSSGDSESSLQNGDCDNENPDNIVIKKPKTGTKLKLRTTLSKLKKSNEKIDAQNNINCDDSIQSGESRSHTISLSRTNSTSTETNSTHSSNSSDEDCEGQKTKLSESKTIFNENKYDGSSRTSILASSGDEVSLSLDKSFKPSPSPKSHKSDTQPRTEEAKSFLMRALAPVTNLFKMRQETEKQEKVQWPDNACDSDSQNTSNIASIATDVESRSIEKPKPIRHVESGERAWWMEPSSEINGDSKRSISRSASKSAELGDNSNSSELKNNGFKYNLTNQPSTDKPWWLDSNGNIPEGVEVRTPSRKGSSDSEQSDKYNVYKIRHIDSGEKDFWQKSESSPKSAEVENLPRSTETSKSEIDWWKKSDSIKKSPEVEQSPKSAENSKSDIDWWNKSDSTPKSAEAEKSPKSTENSKSSIDWWKINDSAPKSEEIEQNPKSAENSKSEIDWWKKSDSAPKSAEIEQSPKSAETSKSEIDWWKKGDSIPKSAEIEQSPKSAETSKSEIDWWKKSDSSPKLAEAEIPKNDDNFTLNVVKIKHIESGERAWWQASNKNIPGGIEKRAVGESDSESSSDRAEERINLKEEINNGPNSIPGFSLEPQDNEYEEPLGDRRSPEGLETPHGCEHFTGRTSPYDNVECNRLPNNNTAKQKTSKHEPNFISRHMDIDDILGTSGQLFTPMMDRILARKTSREIVECDNSECREIDPREVRIHDSTAQRPVIQKLRDRSDIIDCTDEADNLNLDDSALQVYKDGDYGPYLDLESSLSEQQEELEGFHKNRKNYIVLRTQLSVRVHAIREKLLNSDGRELRRALFSLKQIFQEDKDLVHEFVQNDGLDCLIRVGSDADQYYQNYILRALGQVMLYVDGMNGVMKHNASLQWLYSLIASKFRLVVKTTLKLLLVFVEYVDTNCLLLIKAIEAVDCSQGLPPWSNIMNLLKDYDASDTELLIYAMTLINNCLNGIPDQDTYYNQTDCLEDQGIYNIIQRYMSKQGTDLDLLRQFQIYEAVLSHEDGNDSGTPLRQLDDSIRQKLRHRKLVEDSKQGRKSRRYYAGLTSGVTNGSSCDSATRYNQALLQSALADEEDDQPLSPQPAKSESFRDSKEVAMSLQRRRERVQRQREFIKEQQKLSSLSKKEETIETPAVVPSHQIYTSGLQQRIQNGTLGHSGSKDLTLAVNSINKQMDEMDLLESPKANGKADLGQWMRRFNGNGDTSYEEPKIINDDPLNLKKPMLMIDKESTVKDITEKLCSPPSAVRNNQVEEGKVNLVENMTGVISKAMKGLAKSKSKSIVRSPTIEISNKGEVKKTESDFSWDSIIASLDRPLRLKDLDFTDLSPPEETLSINTTSDGWVPPPPPFLANNHLLVNTHHNRVPPPPPGGIPLPPQFSAPPVPSFQENNSSISADYHNKSKKTIKLFWREINDVKKFSLEPSSIWDEIIPVKIESKILEHLFESRTKDVIKQLEINKNKEVIVLDHKRSNAINILLKKLPPPQAIKNAILKMDATVLTREGIDKLIAMLPSEEETLKIQEAQVSNPSIPLGNAEQFLLTLSSISELNARLKLWVFKLDFESIENEIAEPYMDFKIAMEILRKNRTFKKIISAILSTGNFLNGSDAKGFQLEYLSKIHEVKDTVHKHSLLHHLCHIILDQFPETTDLYSEIGPVTRASKVNFEELSGNIERLEIDCKASTNYLKEILKHDGNLMKAKLADFLHDCAERIIILGIIKKRLYHRYTEFLAWLGIPVHRMIETRPSDMFKVISEFALEYRTTRERVLEQRARKACHRERNKTRGKMIMDVGILLGPETADNQHNQLKSILSSQDSTTTSAFNRKRKDPDPIDKNNKNNHSGGIEEVFNSMLTVKCSPDKKSDHHHKRYTKSQKGSSILANQSWPVSQPNQRKLKNSGNINNP